MGFQKRLILRLLFETGIRASELLSIKKNDVEGNRIKINGKGKRERIVYLSN
jgi:integrase/recombinase XerD